MILAPSLGGPRPSYRFVLREHLHGRRPCCRACGRVAAARPPEWRTPLLKTYDKGAIVAHFNTDSFLGPSGATLTVTIDQPFLCRSAIARSRLHPQRRGRRARAACSSARSTRASRYDQTVTVNYAGSSDWQILDVKSSNPHITAKAVETGRADGQVSYALKVRVDATTPAGYLNDHLMLVTNDAVGQQIPVLVEGRVMPEHHRQPDGAVHGRGSAGPESHQATGREGKKPFRILGVSCDDKSFQFDTSKESTAKELHLIPVTFTAGDRCGQSGQDDQDHDRPGPDDARVGGLRGGGRRAVSGLASYPLRQSWGGSFTAAPSRWLLQELPIVGGFAAEEMRPASGNLREQLEFFAALG